MSKSLILTAVICVGVTLGYFASRAAHLVHFPNNQVAWPELQLSDVNDPTFSGPLKSLHLNEKQVGLDGWMYSIDDPKDVSATGVMPEDGRLLYSICRTIKAKNTLEIGFARGVSTLYILAALRANGSGTHTAVDPFERSDWHGIGLKKVEETHSQDIFHFLEMSSIAAIRQLSGQKFDFVFIDGSHLFDDTLVDFRLADLYCSERCVIAIHDVEFLPAVKKAVVFIERNRPDYVRLRSPVPAVGIFRRTGPDKRKWNHYADF